MRPVSDYDFVLSTAGATIGDLCRLSYSAGSHAATIIIRHYCIPELISLSLSSEMRSWRELGWSLEGYRKFSSNHHQFSLRRFDKKVKCWKLERKRGKSFLDSSPRSLNLGRKNCLLVGHAINGGGLMAFGLLA